MASLKPRTHKDGSTVYRLRWSDPNSSESTSSFTFEDRAEALRWKNAIEANGGSLKQAQSIMQDALLDGPTLTEVFEEHLEQLTNVGPYMLARYKAAFGHHFETLAKRKVASLKHRDITTWIRMMMDKGLKPKTIANHHGLLSATLSTAVRSQYIISNPCKGVKLPKNHLAGEEIRFIEKIDWVRIIALMDPFYRPFFEFLMGSGIRFSEAIALLPSDFRLDDPTPTVRITKAWKSDGQGGYYIGPPKTPKAKRTVSLAPATVTVVRPLIESATGLVFSLKRGGVIRSGSAFNRAWSPALKAAGIAREDWPRIHDIRHTHASWMIAAGMEIFALSRRLGHESITTTMDRYSHLLPDAQFNAALVAQKALEQPEA